VFRGPEHVYELANPLYQQLLGNRPLLGKPIREALPELEGQGFYELLDRVYLTGEAFVGTEVRAELDRDNTGHLEEGYFNFVYQPIRTSRGEVEGIMVHAVEVTEQVRARQRMQTFLGIASHELKNPLTSIRGNIQFARRRVEAVLREQAGSEGGRATALASVPLLLERAERQLAFENRLVNDLIDTSRIQAGKLELRLAPADLNAIVREAVEEQRQLVPSRTIELHEADLSSLLVLVDAERIGQVVSNYLSNALKYSAAERAVTVGVAATATEVRVAVRDRGVGLSEEEQVRVWERFYRAPGVQVQSGSETGLGLGLYICQTIIAEHGGRVGVESAKGQGATFWFTLPRSRSVGGTPPSSDH
jgi:signal transduction histidine kinase